MGLVLLLMTMNQLFAQYKPDNPNLDQVPQYLLEKPTVVTDAPMSSVITVGNWDNFSLGVDMGESNITENNSQPLWYFTAYNTNGTYHTENGLTWSRNTPNFGGSVQGDPVVAYDSLGNLFYENMYGNILGSKVVTSTTNGATWGPPVIAIAGNDKNWICCDQTAGPYANYAYTTMTNNGVGNFARSTDHGVTWTSTFAPATQSLPGMMPCVGPEGNIQGGAVYVVTNSGSAFNSRYTFYKSTDGGLTFQQKSGQYFAKYVGTDVGGRNSVENMRTRPYPMIAADNSYGPNRGKLYCIFATNDPPGNGNKPNIYCRSSSDGGTTWSDAVQVNDDPNSQNNHQWHPATWCDKETGKLYVMWMDTRDTPTSDSAYIYASYSTDGGATFVANQRVSNGKMKINCTTCAGSGTPRYQGDYNGIVSNRKGAMAGWTDFRAGAFQSMTAYFPDFAMALDKTSDTLYSPAGNTVIQVSVPEVRLYSDTVLLSATITPVPTAGSIVFEYPEGSQITSFPASKPVRLVLSGSVPAGDYVASFFAAGPNGTPVHKRTAAIKVIPGNIFQATVSASPSTICQGQSSQLNVVVIGGTQPFTYQWTPVTGLTDPGIANPLATPDATTRYHVLVTDNASNTAEDSVLVVVNTPPEAPGPITGIQSVCAGETHDYSIIEVVGGTTYSWSVPADATILSGQNTPDVTVQWGGTSGNVQVIAGNDCGNNPLASVLPVEVGLPPEALKIVLGPDIVCKTSTALFYVSVLDNSLLFNWMVPEDATIVSGQGTDTIHVTWGMNVGDVSVFAKNSCGVTDTISKTVGVSSVPEAAGVITGKDTVCQGQGNFVYSVAEIPGASQYVWELPAGVTITQGQGTNQVTLLMGSEAQSGNIIVKGENNCGFGPESLKPLVVKNCTGIGQNDLLSAVRIFPNPVSGELTITIAGRESSLGMTISEMSGKIVLSEKLSGITADFRKKVDMAGFAKGVYFIKLSTGNRTWSEKVIVQ